MIKKDSDIGDEMMNATSPVHFNNENKKYAVVEFHAPTIAVKENVGKFPVTIWRHGNLNTKATVR